MTKNDYPSYIGFNREPREVSGDSPDNYERYLGMNVVVIGSKIKLEGRLHQIGENNLVLRMDGRSEGEVTGANSITVKKNDLSLIGPSSIILPPN